MSQPVNPFLSKLKVYGLAVLIIGSWWLFAFSQKKAPLRASLESETASPYSIVEVMLPDLPLVGVERNALKQALSGDYHLMYHLISDWNIDAELLKAQGISSIKQLNSHDFLRSQLLGRTQDACLHGRLNIVNQSESFPEVVDDSGKKISTNQPFRRFLPQTYAAASFLLALIPPSQIIALPADLRKQVELYPKALTDPILLDIDRYNSEKLFQQHPDVAFVANYSHPSTLQALENQGILLYMMKDLNTLQAISDELANIGYLINRPAESELMNDFLTAATFALDNQLTLLELYCSKEKKPLPQVLYLNYYHTFSIPTAKTLTGDLLKKINRWDISLKYAETLGQNDSWSLPIAKETIIELDPDCLIIASDHPEGAIQHLLTDTALSDVKAIKNRRFYFVSETIQHSPCQFAILAYSDLIDVLKRL